MSFHVTSLASGSSGNALLIQTDEGALLVDCGLSQRAIERRLRHAGLQPSDVIAIVLTHEHGDHSLSAGPFARRYNIPIVANGPTIKALGAALDRVTLYELDVGETMAVGAFDVRSFLVPHDAAAPVGYTIRAEAACVGIAVDLGSWDESVVAGLSEADLVVVEANHDRERLRVAPYQWPVKQRIFSPFGHLDNVEAGNLLARLGADGRKRTAWLAHLSEQANTPTLALRIVSNVLSLARVDCMRLHALPRADTLAWASDEHLQQLELFGLP
jgi:phosphoribosyl 1,2-cyclic phosphodiesterase